MKKIIGYFLIFCFQIVLYTQLAHWDFFIAHFALPFFNEYQHWVGYITNSLAFSIGDLLYCLWGILGLCGLFQSIRLAFQRNGKGLLKMFKRSLQMLNIFIFWYFLVWGWTYYFPPLLPESQHENFSKYETQQVIEKYAEQCQTIRAQLPEDPYGVMQLKENDSELSYTIISIYPSFPQSFQKIPRVHKTRIKKSLFSSILVYFGIGGYFNPFTQECQYIDIVSPFRKPNIVAHEISHKWGYAPENEANFGAFMAGELGHSDALQYSTKFSAIRHLLRTLYTEDSLYVHRIQQQFSEGMKRDLRADSLLQLQYTSPLDHGFYGLNNTFLKLNNQEGSVSYSRYTQLVLAYERQKGSQNRK